MILETLLSSTKCSLCFGTLTFMIFSLKILLHLSFKIDADSRSSVLFHLYTPKTWSRLVSRIHTIYKTVKLGEKNHDVGLRGNTVLGAWTKISAIMNSRNYKKHLSRPHGFWEKMAARQFTLSSFDQKADFFQRKLAVTISWLESDRKTFRLKSKRVFGASWKKLKSYKVFKNTLMNSWLTLFQCLAVLLLWLRIRDIQQNTDAIDIIIFNRFYKCNVVIVNTIYKHIFDIKLKIYIYFAMAWRFFKNSCALYTISNTIVYRAAYRGQWLMDNSFLAMYLTFQKRRLEISLIQHNQLTYGTLTKVILSE